MLNMYNGNILTNNRKLQILFETKLSADDKVPKTGRILRNKIFVIGFPPNCTEIDLEIFFSNFGVVRESRIVRDENGITKGYAFITFAKEYSVMHALEYRGPLYFMDRKLSINPAVKKQRQFIQNDRYLSPPINIDTSSDTSNSSNYINDINSTNNPILLPTMSVSMLSHSHATAVHHYYNSISQPYLQFSIASHPIYCTSGYNYHGWQQYLPNVINYPTSSYLSIGNNNVGVLHNPMIHYTSVPENNKMIQ